MKYTIFGLLCVSALTAACGSRQPDPASRRQDVILPRDGNIVEALVPRDATFDSLLRQQRISADLAASMVDAVRHVFNPQSLRADQPYRVMRTVDGLFREFQYRIDDDKFLRVVLHPGATGVATVDAHVEAYPKTLEVDGAVAEITREHSSLSSAFNAAGENLLLALSVADVFGGEVDFNADLQRGDRVEVLFERVMRDGEFAGYGDVVAATLRNQGKTLTAIRYPGADGKPAWFDEHGRSLKREFLRSPLKFDPEITSAYSESRLHPIYGDYRAHLGVDYGAPYGAPVIAIAAGVVEEADWAGDAGRMVKIRHTGGYESAYLHLSAFAPGIQPGARVQQGDTIGRVGASGAATGPHLDFRIFKDGVHVNPVTEIKRMPAGVPISADMLPAFTRERDHVLNELRAHAAIAAAHPQPVPHPVTHH